jgi:hypothetical protein
MLAIRITGNQLRAGRALADLHGRPSRSREPRRQQGCQWRGVLICEGLRWCPAQLLLSTLTDAFAFRRIAKIDALVLIRDA